MTFLVLSWRATLKLLVLLFVVGAFCLTVYEWAFLKQLSTGATSRFFVSTVLQDASSTRGTLTRRQSKRKEIPFLERLREIVQLKSNQTAATRNLDAKKRFLCGSEWQEEYIKLHREILEGKRPPRYLVFDCGGIGFGCGGYGNRLGGITSLFYLAVLTNRAFLIHWNSNISIQNYFTPKSISWDVGMETLRGLKTRTHFWGRGFHKKISMETLRFPGSTSKHFNKWFLRTDFDTYFDHPVEVVSSQWLFAQAVRRNIFFRKKSPLLGTKTRGHRYSLVGCAFDFLFSKTPYLLTLLEHTKKSLHFKPRAPTIGIHFRTGDYVLRGEKLKPKSLTTATAFVKCAKRLEDKFIRSTPGLKSSEINWYLATDSKEVKTFVSKRYPKVIYLKIKLEHISQREPSLKGIEGVILDHLLLSECDAIVLSNSSFSQSALGMGFHSLKVSTYGLNCRD